MTKDGFDFEKNMFDFSKEPGLEKLQEINENQEEIEKKFFEAEKSWYRVQYIRALEDAVKTFEGQLNLMRAAVGRAEMELEQFKKNVPEILGGKVQNATGKMMESGFQALSRPTLVNVAHSLETLWENFLGTFNCHRENRFLEGIPGFKTNSVMDVVKRGDSIMLGEIQNLKSRDAFEIS